MEVERRDRGGWGREGWEGWRWLRGGGVPKIRSHSSMCFVVVSV